MKAIYTVLALMYLMLFQACHEPGKIQVMNDISGCTMTDVKWGEFNLASQLIPGQSSAKFTISRNDQKLPCSNKVCFTMTANQKSVYLETVESYTLNEEDDLLISIGNSTKVQTP